MGVTDVIKAVGSSMQGFGSLYSSLQSDSTWQKNYNAQKEFAQNSAGWSLSSLVNTANSLGINPLAVIGSGGTSYYSPSDSTGSDVGKGFSGIGAAMSDLAEYQLDKAKAEADKARAEADKASAEADGLSDFSKGNTSGPMFSVYRDDKGRMKNFTFNSQILSERSTEHGMLENEALWANHIDELQRQVDRDPKSRGGVVVQSYKNRIPYVVYPDTDKLSWDDRLKLRFKNTYKLLKNKKYSSDSAYKLPLGR